MAKAKKTKKVEEVKIEDQSELLQQVGEIKLAQEKYEHCEWCFQFDEDEPQVFAWTDDELNRDEDPKVIFTITNVKDSYITFQNGKTGKLFKIFARELSDEGKEMREKQREAIKNFQKDTEKIDKDASENKETQA
jgi:desulfoferrodoxin (superoxide reductase-like protein)